jgi:hypothetical protein
MILFIAEGEPNSLIAQENLKKICDAHSKYECHIQLVNVLENYLTAQEYNVLVTPCLVLLRPLPRVSIVGTLKDSAKVCAALRLI